MEIRRTSWHYRFIRWSIGGDIASDSIGLCQYFWTICSVIIFFPILLSMNFLEKCLEGLMWILTKIDDWLAKRQNRPKKIRKPSLLKEYLKASKDKVCPMIDIVD